MSRYCGNVDSRPILEAAAHWRAECLEKNGAVVASGELWTIDHLREIEQYFVNRLDEGEGNFFEKLKTQLEPASHEAKQLAAEMMWVMLLCPDNVGFDAKLDAVRTIWGWSDQPFPEASNWTAPEVLNGIGSGGVSYNVGRWRELVFFTRFLVAFKQLDSSEKQRVLQDGWAFAHWIQSIPEAESRQLRHMLLFLLFPDSFERIFGGTDRYQITAHFSKKPKTDINKMPQLIIDQELQLIRGELEEQYKTKDLDFYVAPLLALWKIPVFTASTSGVTRDHVITALEEIERLGIPPDARSTTYDLVYGPNRYPPKYVLSLACKHATGKELDRAEFSGGESSSAFKLLRKLGFQIERKDFVESLVEMFLKQAREGQAYPRRHIQKSIEILT